MFQRVKRALQLAFVLLVVFFILLPILLLLYVVQQFVRLATHLGTSLRPEHVLRRVAFRIFRPEVMRDFRDDVLLIVESRLEEDEDWERWQLLREIDEARERANEALRESEFTFTVVGGILALIVGNYFGVGYLGVALTLVTIVYSVLVTARLIFVEVLAFRSIDHRQEPLRRLAVLRAWNHGPLTQGSEVGMAVASAFASRSEFGYQCGVRIIDIIGEWMAPEPGKWRSD